MGNRGTGRPRAFVIARRSLLAALTVSAATAAVAQAAPPDNDSYLAAAPLTLGTPVTGTLVDATMGTEPNLQQGGEERNVWYRIALPAAGSYTVDVCGPLTGDVRPQVRFFTAPGEGSPPAAAPNRRSGSCAVNDFTAGVETVYVPAATERYVLVTDRVAPASTPGSFTVKVRSGPETEVQPINPVPGLGNLRVLGTPIGSGQVDLECSVDGGTTQPCPESIDLAALGTGPHTFSYAAASEGHRDPSPAVRTFDLGDVPDTDMTIDPTVTTDPVIDYGPGMDFDAQCSMDGLPYTECGSYEDLCSGPHELRARAVNELGVVDPSPVTASWTTTGEACGTPTVAFDEVDEMFGVDSNGVPVIVQVEYGPTAALGFSQAPVSVARDVDGPADNLVLGVEPLGAPGSTMHYRAVVTTPNGTKVVSATRTLEVPAAGPNAPQPTYGEPVVTPTSISIPYTLSSPVIPTATPRVIALVSPPLGDNFGGLADAAFLSSGIAASSGTLRMTGLEPERRYELLHAAQTNSGLTTSAPFAITTPALPVPGGGETPGGGTPGPGPAATPIPAPAPTVTPAPPVSGVGTPVAKSPLGRLTLPKRRTLSLLRAGKLKPSLVCSAACSLRVRVLRGRTVIASGTVKRRAKGTAKVTLRTTKAGRAALRKVRRGKRLRLTFVADALDASGKKVLGSKRVTVSLR